MRINIYAHLIIIEILDDIYSREQTWSTVEYISLGCFERRSQRNLRFGQWPDFSFVLKYNSKLSARVSAVQWVYFEHQYPESGNFWVTLGF